MGTVKKIKTISFEDICYTLGTILLLAGIAAYFFGWSDGWALTLLLSGVFFWWMPYSVATEAAQKDQPRLALPPGKWRSVLVHHDEADNILYALPKGTEVAFEAIDRHYLHIRYRVPNNER